MNNLSIFHEYLDNFLKNIERHPSKYASISFTYDEKEEEIRVCQDIEEMFNTVYEQPDITPMVVDEISKEYEDGRHHFKCPVCGWTSIDVPATEKIIRHCPKCNENFY